MAPNQTNESTGYPPVKQTEQEQAESTARSDQESSGARSRLVSLAANQTTITDAIAAVIEKHRTEIASAPMTPEARQCALDLLDAVFLDVLQTVLNESSALDLLFDKRSSRS